MYIYIYIIFKCSAYRCFTSPRNLRPMPWMRGHHGMGHTHLISEDDDSLTNDQYHGIHETNDQPKVYE